MKPKALPPAKINPAKLLKGSSLIPTVKRISAKSVVDDNLSFGVSFIKKQVIKIGDLIKTNTLLKAENEKRKKKEGEKKRFAKKEEKLEKPKEGKGDKIKLPSLPRLGFLDRIKKFLFNIFLGYISLRLLPYLPKLAGVVGTIIKVQDTVIDVSGKILNGLVSFVDKAYEVHDKTRKFLGNLGGENFTKAFDEFVGAMDKVITASIIAAIAFDELRDMGGPGAGKCDCGPTKNGMGSTAASAYQASKAGRSYAAMMAERNLPKWVQKQLGGSAGRFSDSNLRIALGKGNVGDYVRIITQGKLGRGALSKAVMTVVKPRLSMIPFGIGALIDFGLSWALGENPGRAAFRSIGAGLLSWVGTALGGGIGLAGGPLAIAGAIIGGAAGGIAGDAIGGFLYDLMFGNKNPQNQKVQGRAQGGQVTRGGKYTGPIKRTIKKTPPRTLKVKSTEVKPGQSVGGKDKIKKIFPEEDQTKNVNPLGYMNSSYKTASSTPGLGGLFGIMMKAQLGERPSSADYQSAADGLTAWMQRTVGGGIQRTVGAFAEGGEVDAGMFSNGADMKNVIAKALQDSVAPKVDDILNDLKKQLELKVIEGKAKEGATLPPEDGDFSVSGGTEDFWTLVAVASREDADPQGSADVAQTIYNRLASGAYTGKTIKQLITARNQYQPTWDYPNGPTQGNGNPNPEWLSIQDAESAAAAAGMEVGTIKKVAANILNPTLQKNARDFIQGRTDFKAQGQGVTGISRSARGNVFGWHYNYKENKIASIPNFGATVASRPGGGVDIKLGKFGGNLSAAQQLAASMGLQVTSYLRPGDPGYHGSGRAMDFQTIGAPGNRGTPSQLAFAQAMISKYGTSLKQLIYTPLGFGISGGKQVPLSTWGNKTNSTHYDHVHVAFNKGGKVKGKMGIDQIRAMLTHGEFVLDVNSTTALEDNYPGFLDALNKADYQGALNVLKSYASYEMGATIRAIVDEKLIPVPVPVGSSQQSSMMVSIFDEVEDYMASSYKG
jgi:hypothetical protein